MDKVSQAVFCFHLQSTMHFLCQASAMSCRLYMVFSCWSHLGSGLRFAGLIFTDLNKGNFLAAHTTFKVWCKH
ncbi:hypothetical protein SLA2020_257090 [Shorea laevis]